MIVTEIVEFDKKRSKIFIDGEFLFLLYKGELRDYGIKKDSPLSDETYNEITEELLPKRAIKRAMNLLLKKDYTESKLREKLSEGMYPQNAIDVAVEYVKSYHYIDDNRFARDYISYHIESRSRNRIIQDLMNKGINRELVLACIDEIYSETDGVEIEQIKKLLQKKHYEKCMEYKEKQKIMAYLVRRGYQLDSIKSAMEE